MRKVLVAITAFLATAAILWAQAFESENLTAGASGSAAVSLSNWNRSERVRVAITSASATYVRFARDLLPNADFENFTTTASESPTGYPDMWDASSNLIGWGFTENTWTIELESTTVIYDNASLRFESDATTEMLLNQNMEAVAANDFTDWVEAVNAGTGTITEEATVIRDGVVSAELLGGSAHVDFTSATTVVVASTSYVLSLWGDIGAAGDLLDIRVREATGGTDYLQANGTWAAGEVDFCNAAFDDGVAGTMTMCVVEFTTDAGITGITVSAHADVSADLGRVDAWALTLDDNTTNILATSTVNISDTVADSYVCGFTQYSAAGTTGSSRVEYAIIDPTDSDTATNGIQARYYTGSAWSTTETWLSAAYAATATQTLSYFEARVATGHPVQLRVRPEVAGVDEDIYFDKAFCVATARAGKGYLMAAAGDSIELGLTYPGRFTAISASGTNVVNFAQVQ